MTDLSLEISGFNDAAKSYHHEISGLETNETGATEQAEPEFTGYRHGFEARGGYRLKAFGRLAFVPNARIWTASCLGSRREYGNG